MTVIQRIPTEDYGTVEVGYNGTSLEFGYTDESGNLVTSMVRAETLVALLEENPGKCAWETTNL